MENGKKRMAVLVGCNYHNTPNELHGCINDVEAMRETLERRFGFKAQHIQVLTDKPAGSGLMPTGANIKKALGRMVDAAEAGDVLYFHFSGHGTRIPSLDHAHPNRQDEAIVPCDFNLITDMDFRELVNRLAKEASFTILSDSCHSGGLIAKEKEQIGPSSVLDHNSSTARSLEFSTPRNFRHRKPKSIPFETVLQHLGSTTAINTTDIGTHLLELFGSDASLKFRPHEQQQHRHLFGSSAEDWDGGILLSGCQANETSEDMSPAEGGGKSFGAFSCAVETVLREHVGPLSNRELVRLARKVIQEHRFDRQHPCLYCSDDNARATFLQHP